MARDKKRSISYRSFVICDDPRGIVECQAIRKSNAPISPQKREQPSNKVEGERKQTKRSKSLAVLLEEDKKEVGVEGGIKRELESPTPTPSFEMNNVNNCCSNGKKGHQKNVAKHFFRGALDLHKSLVVVKGPEKGPFGCWGDEKPLFLPGKSLDEMKKVVRESLLRQCVITNPVFEHHFDHGRQLDSPDVPSSSSSQSSMVYSSNFALSDFSSASSSSSLVKMGKSSSLIYKLMGVESFPISPLRHKESEKILKLAKPMYDIISPRARKASFNSALSLKQKSADEILEVLKIKGLLKSNTVNGFVPKLVQNEVFLSESKLDDGKPPIVVLKPMSLPSSDLKESIIPKFLGDSGPGTDEMLTKVKSRRRSPQETVSGDAADLSEMRKEAEGGTHSEDKVKPVRKQASSKAKASGNINQKRQNIQENVKKVSEVVKVTPNRRKAEEKKVVKSSNELRSRDQTRLTPSRSPRQKDDVISKNRDFSQKKAATTSVLDHKMRKTSKSSSQQEKKRQPVLNGNYQGSKGESKKIEAVNEEKEKCSEACHVQITDQDIEEQISLSGPQEDVSMGAQEDDNVHDPNANQSFLSDITSSSISGNTHVGHLEETHSCLLEEPTTNQPQNIHPSLPHCPSPSLREETDPETSKKFLTPRTKLKALMLSSSSFVKRAEELFNLQVNPNSVPSASNEDNCSITDTKLLLDCANEVLEFRNLQLSQACLLLPVSCKPHSRYALSSDRLLEEICNGIEDLKGNLSPTTDILFSDTLYLLVDQDLSFKGGTWENGWRNAFSQDEVEYVIGEIDDYVLGKLIEELAVDFMS